MVCSRQHAEQTMQCLVFILDTTGETYPFYERENTKETNTKYENKEKGRKKQKSNKKKEGRKKKLSCPPAGDVADTSRLSQLMVR